MARVIQNQKRPTDGREANPAQLTGDLRTYLQGEGADLVGFGNVNRLDGAPEEMRPQRYLPDARYMISIGVRVNEAVCDLIDRHARNDTDPPSYHSYQLYTLVMINRELDRLAYLGAKYLEGRGYRAYPFPANVPHLTKLSKEYPGGPGDVSHKHIAVACGLGQIGWCCRWGCSGMLKSTGGYKDIPIPDEEPTDEELLEYKSQVDPWQKRMKSYVGLLPYCGRCYTVCCGTGSCSTG